MPTQTQEQSDPRVQLEPEVLALAKRNAFPAVAQRTGRRDGFALAAGLTGALLLGGATFWSLSGTRAEKELEPAALASEQANREPALAIPPEAITSVHAGDRVADAAIAAPSAQQGGMEAQAQSNVAAFNQPTPVVVFDGSVAAPASGNSQAAPEAAGPPLSGGIELGSDTTPVVSATRMANPCHTVAQGTLISAVLETVINSDLPGYARAVVSMDVKSFDGSRVLVPRSSRLIGEYKSGIAGGQTRVYVLWTRLIRPDGVSVALASPAVDSSGQTGLTGQVNSHFMKRFGSALLLSIVGGASSLATGGSSLIIAGGQSAASVAAQQNGQIPPTIKVRQGQPIRVFTAKDLDFFTVSGEAR